MTADPLVAQYAGPIRKCQDIAFNPEQAQPHHAGKLRVLLISLDSAKGPQDMDAPAWRLHQLTGDLADHWSVWMNGNWRVTFRFDGDDAELVDYQDYH